MASRDREGYILIDRNMCEWKWWQKHNTVIVFLWLLMKAQFHESYFQGRKIERGQIATSVANICKNNNLSRQEARTAISNLKSTNAITTENCGRFLVITISNYCEYQNLTISKNKTQPTSNQCLTNKKPHTNTYNTDNTEKRSKGRSAPDSSSDSSEKKIPEMYKDMNFKSFDEYETWRNQ